MNKTLIIILREYTNRVSKKSFILLTLLMPFLMVALAAVPMLLGKIKGDEQKTVVIVDQTGQYAPLFKTDQHYKYVVAPSVKTEYKDPEGEVEAVVQISQPISLNPKGVTISGAREIQVDLKQQVEDVLNTQLRKEKLAAYNVPNLDRIIEDVNAGVDITTIKWGKDGSEQFSSTDIAIAAGFLFTFLIYLFVMMYGGMVMQSVMEEKTNRIMEIMVSSVRPFQLMMGKIIGVALVGFTQLLIWGVMIFGLFQGALFLFGDEIGVTPSATQMATNMPGANPEVLAQAATDGTGAAFDALYNLPFVEMGILFVLYFIGGYLLFASFFAAVGASVNSQEDSSQFMTPMIFILIFGMYAAMGSADNTHGPLAFWASLFPLTSPIVMMVRIPFDVPLWQEVLSLALLYGTAIGMVWISAKIYRVGILMYGKKPTLKEMIKWVRYH